MGNKLYDVIIVGGGPAGFAAALYAARARLNTLLIEKMFSGGMMATTHLMENYPGFEEPISGPDLAIRMENQARKFGAQVVNEQVLSLQLDTLIKTVNTDENTYLSKVVILCTGTTPKTLGLNEEERFQGSGLSYCATCDGAFYRNQAVAVVGGGDTAVEDALYLARICSHVTIVHRRDTLRATRILQEEVFNHKQIELRWNSELVQILGEKKVAGIKVRNLADDKVTELAVAGVFLAVGSSPNTELVREVLQLSEGGYIRTNEQMETNLPGVYAAGDVRDKIFRQVITAAADGSIAASMAERYISQNAAKEVVALT